MNARLVLALIVISFIQTCLSAQISSPRLPPASMNNNNRLPVARPKVQPKSKPQPAPKRQTNDDDGGTDDVIDDDGDDDDGDDDDYDDDDQEAELPVQNPLPSQGDTKKDNLPSPKPTILSTQYPSCAPSRLPTSTPTSSSYLSSKPTVPVTDVTTSSPTLAHTIAPTLSPTSPNTAALNENTQGSIIIDKSSKHNKTDIVYSYVQDDEHRSSLLPAQDIRTVTFYVVGAILAFFVVCMLAIFALFCIGKKYPSKYNTYGQVSTNESESESEMTPTTRV